MKMKKLWLGFAVCALITTSCSQQEMMENITDGQGQLSFAAGTAQQGTRAAELNNTTLQSNEITLWAYHNVNNTWGKWYNDVVEFSGNKWALKNSVRFRNTNATKYITYSSKVPGALIADPTSFSNANFTLNSTFPKFKYTVAANSTIQEDLIAGITEVDANKTDITLGMRHILSQVNFGTVGYKGAKIQIQNIKIVGVANSADFTYFAVNTYPIGKWSIPTDFETDYDYFNWGGLVANNPQPLVPATANRGDKYIFGDGGNWGPGKGASVFYPVGTNGIWETYNTNSPQTGLSNSLMLLPQTLTNTAKVTFEYKIQDVDNAYIAGNSGTWEKGEFKLNFTTGTTSGTHYLGKWEQNYRYVYLIDFTDFLDGVALTFKVDVEMYEWENYNKDTTENDGIVEIMAAGQPSQADMNAATFVNGKTFYIASRTPNKQTAPTTADWAQVMRNEIWDLSAYDFANIGNNESFTLSFQNVIFNTTGTTPNPTTITMTLPAGYTAVKGTGITMTGTNPYSIRSGDKTINATVTISNTNKEYLTAAKLQDAVKPLTANDNLIYKGTTDVNLRAIEPTSFTQGITVTVKFINGVVPTVGDSDNGRWTWNAATKTATLVKR